MRIKGSAEWKTRGKVASSQLFSGGDLVVIMILTEQELELADLVVEIGNIQVIINTIAILYFVLHSHPSPASSRLVKHSCKG